MRLIEHENEARRRLAKAGVESPALSSRLLVAHVAKLDKIGLLLAAGKELSASAALELEELVKRRARGEPLAYLLGKKEFYGIDFFVDASTLVPRPETELLVDLALSTVPNKPLRFADLGCGSGCIGLALLKHRQAWQGLLLDKSAKALAVARRNAKYLGVACGIIRADLFHPPIPVGSLNLIVSNPPYIAYAESASVMPECIAFEPHSALFSPKSGLAHLEAVITGAARMLPPNGWLFLEHGMAQAKAVTAIMRQSGFKNIASHRDLAGLDRCASCQKG